MFDTPTVFILGAGASCHYGYPTGEQLVKDVIAKTDWLTSLIDRNQIVSKILNTTFIQKEILPQTTDQHLAWRTFFDLCDGLSRRLRQINPPVIDYFLRENSDLQAIGKLMIALVMLDAESVYNRQQSPNNNQNHKIIYENSPFHIEREKAKSIKLYNFKDDWYRFILYRLTLGCQKSEDILKNKVTFVTFNYDVSLERMLKESLDVIDFFKSGTTSSIIDEFLTENRFLHVYGKIRDNPFNEAEQIDYKSPTTADGRDQFEKTLIKNEWIKDILEKAYEASRNLKTISPNKTEQETPEVIAAREKIESARDVFILGYGFDENNSKLLNLQKSLIIHNNKKARIYFTNYGDKQAINKRASKLLFRNLEHFGPNDPYNRPTEYAEKSIRNVYSQVQIN